MDRFPAIDTIASAINRVNPNLYASIANPYGHWASYPDIHISPRVGSHARWAASISFGIVLGFRDYGTSLIGARLSFWNTIGGPKSKTGLAWMVSP